MTFPDPMSQVTLRRWQNRLGDDLWRWWLKPEALERLGELTELPTSPSGRGDVLMLLVNRSDQTGQFGCLREAMALPLRWQTDRPTHDRRLPPSLLTLADQVRQTALKAFEGAMQRELTLTLWLNPEVVADGDRPNLADLGSDKGLGLERNFSFSSGWAALLGGAVTAIGGGRMNPKVLASAAWREDRGLEPVGGLDLKMQLAREFGASELFVAEPDYEEHHASAPDGLSLRALPILTAAPDKPVSAIKQFLDRMWVPPTPKEPLGERINYYRTQARLDRSAGGKYYIESLLGEDFAQHLHLSLRKYWAEDRPNALFSTISHAEAVLNALLALQPSRCLLLFTEDSDYGKEVDKVEQHARRLGIETSIQRAMFKNEGKKLLGQFLARLQEHDPAQNRWAVDLTPGNKPMTLAMMELCQKLGPDRAVPFYQEHRIAPHGVPDPMSLELIPWVQ